MLVVHSDSDVFHIRPFAESFTAKRIQALTEDVFGDAQKAAPVLNAVDWPEQAFALPGPAFDAAVPDQIYPASF